MTRTSPAATRRMTALALAALVGALPAQAQTQTPDPGTARVLAAAKHAAAPQPILDAVRTASASHRAEIAPAAAPAQNGCGNRVVLGGVLGGGAGAAIGVGLLYGAGGSDSAGRIVASMAVIGALLGAVGGLVACGP